MVNHEKEFSLNTRSKIGMGFLFLLVGGPMLYAAYLNYTVHELLYSVLMILLFLLWAVVIVAATGYKIRLTDSSIHREGLISPSIIDFKDITAIHFGSTWSNFYIQSEDDTKIYFGKDFKDFDDILRNVVEQIDHTKDLTSVDFLGDPENIQEYTSGIPEED